MSKATSTPASMEPLAIGIDIGGTGTKFGIVDRIGNVLFTGDLSTKKHRKIETFIDELHDKLMLLIQTVGGPGRIRGIGVGAPNGNFYTGTVDYAPNLPWKGIIPLAQLIQDKFQLPTNLTNDANAAAIGEMMYGAAQGMKDFIMITLGTGVGSGIVANGHLILGHDGFSGELGPTINISDGRKSGGTGKYGSLESYASATGVMLTAKEVLGKTKEESVLRKIPLDEIDSRKVYDAAVQGDKIAREIFDYTGKI